MPRRTTARTVSFISSTPKKSVKDYWSERGEQGRWVRMHIEPRLEKFDPWRAPRGPGRKTKLHSTRITQGTDENGNDFHEKEHWQRAQNRSGSIFPPVCAQVSPHWTGRTIFIVDRRYSKEYGTDQRRQRTTIANLNRALV